MDFTYDKLDQAIYVYIRLCDLLSYDDKPIITSDINEFNKFDGQEVVRVVHSYHGQTADEAYNNTLYLLMINIKILIMN